MKIMLHEFPVLSTVLGVREQDVQCDCRTRYNSFQLKARGSKKIRTIDAPCPHLKQLQRALLDRVLAYVEPHHAATAFIHGKSIATNARSHHGASHLFTTDIRSFFPSITATHVNAMLEKRFRYLSSEAIGEIVSLVTWNAILPQGAPTSPQLANLVMYDFDEQCHWFCDKIGAVYTRYADDISISAADADVLHHLESMVRGGLASLGMEMHTKKTRYFGPHQRKIITGLDIGGEQVRPTRAFCKKSAALVRMTVKYPNKMVHHRDRICGHLAFWYAVNPKDPELAKLLNAMGLHEWAKRVLLLTEDDKLSIKQVPSHWDDLDEDVPF
jgi:retron-type reverse transcriptase